MYIKPYAYIDDFMENNYYNSFGPICLTGQNIMKFQFHFIKIIWNFYFDLSLYRFKYG